MTVLGMDSVMMLWFLIFEKTASDLIREEGYLWFAIELER